MLQREITLTMWFNVIYVTFIRKHVLKETLQLQSLGLIRLYCDYTVSDECTSFRIFNVCAALMLLVCMQSTYFAQSTFRASVCLNRAF